MQTIAVNNEAYGTATEATVFGPFFVADAPQIDLGGDIAGGAAGEPCWVEGTVTGHRGQPARRRPDRGLGGGRGRLLRRPVRGRPDRRPRAPVQRCGRPVRLLGSDADALPHPARRPCRRDAGALRPLPVRASHLHFMVSAPDRRTLVTHIFVAGAPPGQRLRLRREGVPDQGLRRPAARNARPPTAATWWPVVDEGTLRRRPPAPQPAPPDTF